MRSGCLIVAACLAACGGGEGIWIEVQGTPETTRVEVFIASEAACEKCELQPKDVRSMLTGSRFTRDSDPLLAVTADSAHVAEFGLAPNAKTDKVRSIVVVGYDAAMNISGAALIKNLHTTEPHRYRATLMPVTGEVLAETAPMSGSQRAQVWGSEEVHGKCVGLERWSSSELTDRTFIVPADDPDCDGVLEDAECKPYAYLSSTVIASDIVNCVTDAEDVDDERPCQLGAATCVDGGPRGLCVPNGACVPQSICQDPTPCPPGEERQCLLEKLQRSPLSAAVTCFVPFEEDPGGGQVRTCGGQPAAATIDGLTAAFIEPNVTCTEVGVIGTSGAFTFEPTVQLGSSSTLEVAVVAGMPTCSVAVKWTGSYESPSASQPIVVGLKITTNGAHDLVVPLRIEKASCLATPTPTCFLDLDRDDDNVQDPIAACAR